MFSVVPKQVTDLTLTATTTTVELTWQRQSDYKPSYLYLVEVHQHNKLLQNDSSKNETYTFFNLCPGSYYTFKVITVVGGSKSAETNGTSHTSRSPRHQIF